MRSTVRVTFIDESTSSTLGEVELSAARLPQSFATATTLHLGDDDWLVVHAEPANADEYLALGALRLTLRHTPRRPQDSLAPRAALFAYPTLADPLPAQGGPRTEGGAALLELGQDEWRQIELVGPASADLVARELAEVERVVKQGQTGSGYKHAYARTALSEPMAGVSLSLSALREVFPRVEREYAAVAFAGFDRVVESAFAFRTAGGLLVYGIARGEEPAVEVLGLRPDRGRRGPPVDAGAVTLLRRRHGLLLVDWCARTAVRAPGTVPASHGDA